MLLEWAGINHWFFGTKAIGTLIGWSYQIAITQPFSIGDAVGPLRANGDGLEEINLNYVVVFRPLGSSAA